MRLITIILLMLCPMILTFFFITRFHVVHYLALLMLTFMQNTNLCSMFLDIAIDVHSATFYIKANKRHKILYFEKKLTRRELQKPLGKVFTSLDAWRTGESS